MRHFSGKIKARILLALLSLVWLRPYQTILPFFREISPLLPYSTVLKKIAISDHIALFSHRLRIYAQRTCALQSRIARSVTMERRSFARTLFCHTSTGCIFTLDAVSIDNRWNHSHSKSNEFVVSIDNSGTTATVSHVYTKCLIWIIIIILHGLIFGGYQNILPALGPYCTCLTDACNMVLAPAI